MPKKTGIEVSGDSLAATIEAFKLFPGVVKKYMEKFGLVAPGRPFDRKAWYPQEAWLACHAALAVEVGANTMFRVGKAIPDCVPLPPMATDIFNALVALDIGYHMNHRKNGKLMFDPATGQMSEGIGHYLSRPVEGENKIHVIASDPYDCAFDRGLLYGVALKFSPHAAVSHVDDQPCRKQGGASCTYSVTW